MGHTLGAALRIDGRRCGLFKTGEQRYCGRMGGRAGGNVAGGESFDEDTCGMGLGGRAAGREGGATIGADLPYLSPYQIPKSAEQISSCRIAQGIMCGGFLQRFGGPTGSGSRSPWCAVPVQRGTASRHADKLRSKVWQTVYAPDCGAREGAKWSRTCYGVAEGASHACRRVAQSLPS
jgi:hypothetical protein